MSAPGNRHGRKQVTLDCQHVVWFSKPYPSEGADVWCVRCQLERMVIMTDESLTNFGVRCDDCRYGRRFGADGHAANQAATRHGMKRSHAAQVVQGRKVVWTFQPDLSGRADDADPWSA